MPWINGIVVIILITIYLCSRKYTLPAEWNGAKWQQSIDRMSYFIYQRATGFCASIGVGRGKVGGGLPTNRIKNKLQSLHPTEDSARLLIKYRVEQISMSILVILAGTIAITMILISNNQTKNLVDGHLILRNEHGEGALQTTLMAEIEETNKITEKEEMEVLVGEKKYNKEELDVLYRDFCKTLYRSILGENASLQQITGDMILPITLAGYPFRIEWTCSDYSLIGSDGILEPCEVEPKGKKIILTACVSYQDWTKTKPIEICIRPKQKTPKEEWRDTLLAEIEAQNQASETKESLRLPQQWKGHQIRWTEKEQNPAWLLCVLLLLSVVGICYGKAHELQTDMIRRQAQMLQDYPEIVDKITLLLTAGMTIRTAWKKIGNDYLLKKERGMPKRYAYEEMLIASYEMESGVSECKSYDNFAKRCGVACYLKLGGILIQNLKKGSARLQEVLQQEAKEAFEERKNTAKRYGEEAGTKLLLPMMLMLAVVIVVIIVPAFLSFHI
ncbi:MAG: hypothetical protein RRX92_01310 [Lachnospiraceae bacterium]